MGCREFERRIIGSVELLRLLMAAVFPPGADCMDDISGFQLKAGGDDGRAGIAVSDLAAGFLQRFKARSPEDGSADAAAGPKAFIGGIDDGIGVQGGNTGFSDLDRTHGLMLLTS